MVVVVVVVVVVVPVPVARTKNKKNPKKKSLKKRPPLSVSLAFAATLLLSNSVSLATNQRSTESCPPGACKGHVGAQDDVQ